VVCQPSFDGCVIPNGVRDLVRPDTRSLTPFGMTRGGTAQITLDEPLARLILAITCPVGPARVPLPTRSAARCALTAPG